MSRPLSSPSPVSPASRRALVVATNFPPDASVGTMRTLRLVRHLAGTGWTVDVLTGAPERYRAGTICDPALLARVPIEASVTRVPAWRPIERLRAAVWPPRRDQVPTAAGLRSAGSAASRAPERGSGWATQLVRAVSAALAIPDREVSWLLPAIGAGWRRGRSHRPDVIYSSGPPFTSHVVAAALARLLRRPWVADFRDPWARAPWRDDRFAFERKAWSVLERQIVSRADAVLFVTRRNRQEFAGHYGEALARRFLLVPNGCDPADFHGLTGRARAAGDPFVLLHAGSLYGARNPAPLFRAVAGAIAAGAIDPARFRLRFIGRIGMPGLDLPRLVRALGLGEVVEFVAHMPRQAVLQAMRDASALLILQPVTTVAVPAKLYEYMAAGRPVLALAEDDGETAEVVRQSRAGLVVPAEDGDAIAGALVTLVARDGTFVPAGSDFYDGTQRALEMAGILSAVVEREFAGLPRIDARATVPTEVTRS